MKILAIDPGETTGILFMDTEHLPQLTGCTTAGWQGLDIIISSTQPDVIVIEAFRLYGRAARAQIGSSFPTVEVIGVVKYLAHQGRIRLVEQMAGQVHLLKGGERFESPHVRSAWKHAEYFRRRI